MNHKKTFLLVAFIGVLLTVFGFQTSPEYKILFEKAKFTMETKGDLNGAINLFNDIIKKYPKEREYAAKSQLYIGLCYEKSGVKEAQKAYESVVREYADQSEIVAQARVRLAALGEPGGTGKSYLQKGKNEANIQLILKKLDFAQLNSPFAHLSPDGKKIAYLVYGKSNTGIGILDLESGAAKVLVESGADAGGQAALVWSPQRDKIAYTVHGKELHIHDIDGANFQVLIKDSEYMIIPTDWSRDGKKILCFFMGDDFTVRIGTVTSDGQVKFLVSGNSTEFASEPKFSPDGDYIAFSQGEKNGNTDIYILTSDGSRKERVVAHPGRDENPAWSPDGKYLVFLSDRNRSVDLWGVQIKNGTTVGGPFIIKKDLGWRTRIQDLIADGKLFLFMLGGPEPGNLFTIPVDQANGNLSGPIAPISVFPTDHSFPRYSPDGKLIAYLSRRGQLGWPKLYVMDEKGAERELSLRGHYAVNIAWHPENRSLFFAGWDKAFKPGIYEILLETGEIRSVYISENIDYKTGKGRLFNINLLSEAGEMMFFKFLENGNEEVITYKSDGQQPTVVLPQVKMPDWGSPSPNGENICYRLGDSLMIVSVSNGVTKYIGTSTRNLEATWSPNGESLMFREGSRLRIFSLKESNIRTLYQAPAGKTIGGMEMYANSWSPNGSCFIITERDTSASSISPQRFIMINPGDGSIKSMGEAPEGYRLSELRWSPEGSRIVATGTSLSSKSAPAYEYWVMENFLTK